MPKCLYYFQKAELMKFQAFYQQYQNFQKRNAEKQKSFESLYGMGGCSVVVNEMEFDIKICTFVPNFNCQAQTTHSLTKKLPDHQICIMNGLDIGIFLQFYCTRIKRYQQMKQQIKFNFYLNLKKYQISTFLFSYVQPIHNALIKRRILVQYN